ncbi:MAG: 1-acyl-sn-glycerol-3-phosphate acyltransferase [Lentisphaeria bacterium]|nr:1-acyl-sn-glycerol-3-phosphate acyltransferase [Lentisphaeria bacterium]
MFISTLIYVQFLFCTAVYTILAAPFCTWGMIRAKLLKRGDAGDVIRYFILLYGKTILRFVFPPWIRLRYENTDGTSCCGGIYVFNHRSASDPFLVAAVSEIPPAQIANDWPMRLPFLGFFARLGGYIDIKNLTYEEVLKKVRELVSRGIPVMAFPEGTRSGNRQMNQFYSTVFRVAKELECPLTPVVIAGNEEIPNRQFKMKCGHILIRKLPPLDPEMLRSESAFVIKQKIRSIILEESMRMDAILDQKGK